MNYKDVTIDDKLFRINRMSAKVGSRILNVLLSAMFKVQTATEPSTEPKPEAVTEFSQFTPEQKAEGSITAMWIAIGSTVSEEVYDQLQDHCLQVCSFYHVGSDVPPVPIMMANGQWAVKELEQDIKTVNQLIQEALKFNLAPFFTESASSTQAAPVIAPTSQPPIRRVTGTFPGQ